MTGTMFLTGMSEFDFTSLVECQITEYVEGSYWTSQSRGLMMTCSNLLYLQYSENLPVDINATHICPLPAQS